MPLWFEDTDYADRVYAAMRAKHLPVLRWVRQWPGTPELPTDAGADWRFQVIQMLCHQSLADVDIASVCAQTRQVFELT